MNAVESMIITETDPAFPEVSALSNCIPQPQTSGFRPAPLLGVPISPVSMKDAVDKVNRWVKEGTRTRLVTFTNVHMIVEAQIRPGFRSMLQRMDMNCPDGAPIYWLTKWKERRTEKVSGPDFMPQFCEQSISLGHRHFLYGGSPEVTEAAVTALRERYPALRIVGHYSPPFRELSADETDAVLQTINASRADIVWVCLGCPRQETWMSQHQDRLNAKVLLAVGQAFDLIAGRTSRAPALLRRCGLEWLFRLGQEPARLWKRYLVTNLLFSLLLLRDALTHNAESDAN
jgi:N-acetylglucosaminyldiphosphoundecaprenol N-acetyl-beta-D-mannosaminyltransferase